MNYDIIESRIRDLVDACGHVIDDSNRAEVLHFIEVGEYGVAVEALCFMLAEPERHPSRHLRQQVRDMAVEMEIDRSIWGALCGPD